MTETIQCVCQFNYVSAAV